MITACINLKNREDYNYIITLIEDLLNRQGIEHEIFTKGLK
jgi:hypothetical protein